MQKDLHAIWQGILGEVELTLSTGNYTVFWSKTKPLSFDGNEMVFEVPNIYVQKNLQTKFDKQIRDLLAKNELSPATLTYIVASTNKKPRISRETTATSLPLMEASSIASPAAASVGYKATPSPLSARGNLNPRYTFDNFIVGSSNDLAYSASQAVAANPGVKYNPIYFYGGVGLGKTHLMQAIGNEILKNTPDSRVLYVSSETFVNEFLDYIRFKKKGFSDKYRNVDVLIVDDMQFIANKEKTQEEFFHTFNFLHQNNKQIIISSDKPPKSIPTLTERLRSRFEMGMSIDIQMPDFETRCAIINAKAGISGVTLNSETVEFLANNIKTNIRELEGALNQLLAYAELHHIEPDVTTAEGLLGNVRISRPQHLTSKQIIDKTARHFQLRVEEICGSQRDKHIVVPRQIAMYLLRSELHLSFPKIAGELGRKDHTTAIHSVEKIEKAIKLDYMIREQVNAIRERLYA
ncbi:chromosomal replication initiator DnaA [Candidatus Saccharibacteria bacterium 47-87]|nr:chromosomal replication initiator protein DnaA [Candidatus Saccharibacteria bacterium]OJU96586.1 MAG: chromosomal replication initiator DnaA [Candidatus Saccharibacteria bacterium 47-87]